MCVCDYFCVCMYMYAVLSIYEFRGVKRRAEETAVVQVTKTQLSMYVSASIIVGAPCRHNVTLPQ